MVWLNVLDSRRLIKTAAEFKVIDRHQHIAIAKTTVSLDISLFLRAQRNAIPYNGPLLGREEFI